MLRISSLLKIVARPAVALSVSGVLFLIQGWVLLTPCEVRCMVYVFQGFLSVKGSLFVLTILKTRTVGLDHFQGQV